VILVALLFFALAPVALMIGTECRAEQNPGAKYQLSYHSFLCSLITKSVHIFDPLPQTIDRKSFRIIEPENGFCVVCWG
jgi:hypothetical protein